MLFYYMIMNLMIKHNIKLLKSGYLSTLSWIKCGLKNLKTVHDFFLVFIGLSNASHEKVKVSDSTMTTEKRYLLKEMYRMNN